MNVCCVSLQCSISVTFVTIVTKEIFSGSFDGRLVMIILSFFKLSLILTCIPLVERDLLKRSCLVCYGVWYFNSWLDISFSTHGITCLVNSLDLLTESFIL